MKALVQRVTRASVTGKAANAQKHSSCVLCTVGEREVSAIGRGICVLLGISRYDTQKEAEWM